MKSLSLYYFIICAQLSTSCNITKRQEYSDLASPAIGTLSKPFKARPVEYVVPPKHCSTGKIIFPNASTVNAKIQDKKPIITSINSENLVLNPPSDPYETWLDDVVQEMSKRSEEAINRDDILQSYRRFSANGDCPQGSEWCNIAAKHLNLGYSSQIASDEIEGMLSRRYGAFLDKKEDEAFRRRLFLSLEEPLELQGKNGKSYQAVLDYEKWVWKYSNPTTDKPIFTNRMYYGLALYRSLKREKLGNDNIDKYLDSVTPEQGQRYRRSYGGGSENMFNTTFEDFFDISHSINSFYKHFNGKENIRAKSIRGYLETWLQNKGNSVKNHLFKAYDKSVGGIENELKNFISSVPNYKGDLWLPMIRGDRQFANKLMLNIAEISEKDDGKFRLSDLLPGLLPGRLLVGDLDSLVASEGTAFNPPPEDSTTPTWHPQTFMQNQFYGILVRIKSPEIKVTYPLYQPKSGFSEYHTVRNATSNASYTRLQLPTYSFPAFVDDSPDSYYKIERIEKINHNLMLRNKNDPKYNEFKANSFDILITIVKS